ncbi:thiol-disulfide oxidoreductase DCC family protein [Tenacibaculum xiamenense]|uniref:thiol-disulfide oxidoreductase DCC family protein n=1 Tax=Tenacibaculum xiamenense TaxID=1261553 RepID=UPI003892E134
MENILIYDGLCGFCNKTVVFLAELDSENHFKFISDQSELGREILKKNNLTELNKKTIIVVSHDNIYIKSNAIYQFLKITKQYYALRLLMNLIPIKIKDWVYDIISENRRKLTQNTCSIPNEQIRKKFQL